LDIGASNGGFTDSLLQRGAVRVYAVDVNVEQLDWKLRQNSRVIPIARNARELRVDDLPESVDIVVIDVSFISVRKVIAPAMARAKTRADFLILIKPQFELRREEIGPGGIVRDQKLHDKAILAVRECVASVGLESLGVRPSHLLGAEGNQEYFLTHAKRPWSRIAEAHAPGQTFQTIGIISRPRRSNLAIVVPPLLKWLEAHGIKILIDEETANCLPDGSKGETRQRVADARNFCSCLG